MILYAENSDKKKNMCKQLEALSVQLLDYLEKPSQEHQVEVLLKNLCHDLKFIDDFSFYLKEGYLFNTKTKILYNKENKEIKLTKNEIKFMEIMSNRKEQYSSSEFIEHSICIE